MENDEKRYGLWPVIVLVIVFWVVMMTVIAISGPGNQVRDTDILPPLGD